MAKKRGTPSFSFALQNVSSGRTCERKCHVVFTQACSKFCGGCPLHLFLFLLFC